jgi:hypothetical protein
LLAAAREQRPDGVPLGPADLGLVGRDAQDGEARGGAAQVLDVVGLAVEQHPAHTRPGALARQILVQAVKHRVDQQRRRRRAGRPAQQGLDLLVLPLRAAGRAVDLQRQPLPGRRRRRAPLQLRLVVVLLVEEEERHRGPLVDHRQQQRRFAPAP